ncbi:MAG: AAA family ATPase [Deinococcota bacterium]|jgi:predicted ATPase|nr:AAA family ATPase [Deinococcota bacterium]
MRIEQLTIKKFRVFRDVTLENIPRMSVFVGANGTGKSTLFDVFGFLRDALTHNVRQALARRGNYREVISRGTDGPIEIELKFRAKPDDPLVTYAVSIGLKDGSPIVQREVLKYRRGQTGRPWHFLDFQNGEGVAITNEEEYEKPGAEEQREHQKLDSPDILAIKGLGQFQRFRVVSDFRRLIENWHVSDFHISDARPSQEAGYAEHLSSRGDNLALVAQYMFEDHRDVFDKVLKKIAQRVPGVEKVEATETEDGRIVLRFQDGSFKDPFIARYVSDGTIKMFAYLILLHDPSPHPLLCIEEPENQLYPELLQELAEEFRDYARRGGQVFVSTHSPDFLNGINLNEVFWLQKKEGFTVIERTKNDELLRNLVAEGDSLGTLWRQGLFEGAYP